MPKRPGGDPQPLGDLLHSLVSKRGWDERMRFGRLREEWAEVVGPDVAARSTPVALSAGVLSIKADGAAWASELTLLARSTNSSSGGADSASLTSANLPTAGRWMASASARVSSSSRAATKSKGTSRSAEAP